jgi:hypothetical protein
MRTQYTEWLNGLAAARKGPVMLPTATRNLAYRHIVSLNADFTDATVIGQIRSSPDSGSILASFQIGEIIVEDEKTAFTISLAEGDGENSTGSLPPDGDMNGMEYFPYDILIALPGDPLQRLFGGLLPVSGHVSLEIEEE